MEYIREIMDTEFTYKVDRVNDRDYSVRYYREGEMVGVVRGTIYESVGKMKPIRQRSVIISSAQVGEMFSDLIHLIKEEDLMNIHEVIMEDVRNKILSFTE